MWKGRAPLPTGVGSGEGALPTRVGSGEGAQALPELFFAAELLHFGAF